MIDLLRQESIDLLPNFFCVGVEKSGSTHLYDLLSAHPDIFMPSIKETHFFSTDVGIENFREDYKQHEEAKNINLEKYFASRESPKLWEVYIRDPAHYLRLYNGSKGYFLRGEVCNSYLYSDEAIANIAASIPDARIIVMLRNPADRAYSHYSAMLRDGRTIKNSLIDEIQYDLEFEDRRWGSCHGYIDHGRYSGQLERLYNIFKRDQVKVVLSDEFFDNTDRVMAEIFTFLGADSSTVSPDMPNRNRRMTPRNARILRILGRTGVRSRISAILPAGVKKMAESIVYSGKTDPISPLERDFLGRFFHDDIVATESILRRKLSGWRA